MRPIDADELLKAIDTHMPPMHGQREDLQLVERATMAQLYEIIDDAPTINAAVLPCPIGSDCWWVSSETLEVECEKGGITGFTVLKDEILALDLSGNPMKMHSQWCCLTREEAEAFREKLLKERT